MNPILLQNFVQLIANQTGLQIRDRDHLDLIKKIGTRVIALKLAKPEAYYQLLTNISAQDGNYKLARSSQQEWEALTLLLTTGETYFFRDQGQLNLIKEEILPEIIARKQQAQAIGSQTKPILRIWSAGCSTGEEPYSLAMIIKDLIPNYYTWNLLILGTDLNIESITKAKQGKYSEWSFRMVKTDIKRRHFRHQNNVWQLNEEICRMVTFKPGNLLVDEYPSLNADIYNMDLIICRNVFIYFDSENVSTILAKFYSTLAPGGYLVSGHAELHDVKLGGFAPKAYDDSVVYLRSEDLPAQPKPKGMANTLLTQSQALTRSPTQVKSRKSNSTKDRQPRNATGSAQRIKTSPALHQPSLTPTSSNPAESSTPLSEAHTCFEQGNYQQVIQLAEQFLKRQPNQLEAIYLIAQAYANLGLLIKAKSYCEQAIALDPLSTNIYYLLAHLAEEQNQLDQAKEHLKRIIYLDASAIAAYLDLSSLYQLEGDSRRAKKMLTTGAELLRTLPPDLTIQYRGGPIKVAELLKQVNANI